MKRKLFALAAALTLAFALAVTASADILWEPTDVYYDYEKSETVARTYYVPEGMTVNLYRSPNGGALIKTMEAGTRVYVGFRQEVGGEVWGVGYPIGDHQNEGWFRLGRLQLEYDNEEFMKDHEVTSVEAAVTDYVVQDQIYTWTYPGSGVWAGSIFEINSSYDDGKVSYHDIYTDPDGGRWGYVGYYMGRCGWIYLDDLENPNPPQFLQEAASTVTDTSPTENAPVNSTLWLIAALVAVVAVGTGILIVCLKRKNKK